MKPKGWFRVFGYGLWWVDTKRVEWTPLFSDRHINRIYKVGSWRFKVLKP